jgi:predicted outer membrane repeat protein
MKKNNGIFHSIIILFINLILMSCSIDDPPRVNKNESYSPGVPLGVTVTAGDGQTIISWTVISGASSYNIYWNTTGNVITTSAKVTGATTPFVHTDLINGTMYYYRVSAVNAGVESGLSVEVSATPEVNTYSIGGTISGLTGTLILNLNAGAQTKSISADGNYAFGNAIADGSVYSVAVQTQPLGQTCSIANDSGTVSGGNVSNANVTCSVNTYSIGGTVSGLSGTVILNLNSGAQTKSISADGNYAFGNAIADGSVYSVTIQTQPAGQTCSIANGSGTVSGGNVSNANVTCSVNTYSIGGTVSGLGGTVILNLNAGAQTKSISADGNYAFGNAIAEGSTYSVTVQTQPAGQTCSIGNGSGTVSGGNVTNVNVDCLSVDYITITFPNGGQLWRVGVVQTIHWNSSGISNVRIELYRNGSWEYIDGGGSIYNTNSFDWTVTSPLAVDAKIKVSDADGGLLNDESDTVFEIAGRLWYVDSLAVAGGDGKAWNAAFQYVQDGVAAASAGDEVWVKAGTYSRKGSDTTMLGLKANVKVYGGFAGTESMLSQRNLATNITSLSGASTWHIVSGANNARLDGFTITGGVVDTQDGNGLLSSATGLEIANCTFSGNKSDDGGAVYLGGGSVTFTNCFFSSNEARNKGGAVYSVLGTVANFNGCSFTGNIAHGWDSDGRGGAINATDSNVTVDNSNFENNEANASSGIGYGGAMYNYDSIVIIKNSIFKTNNASNNGIGAAIYNHMSASYVSANISNSVFLGNWARGTTSGGGAIASRYAYYDSPVTIINSSFSGNESDGVGGAIYNISDCDITISNSILYFNYANGALNQIYNADTSTAAVTYSDVQGGYSGTGNINSNPYFVNSNSDLHLTGSSSCIDAANGSIAPLTDKEEKDRWDDPNRTNVSGTYVDMGAYEYQP